MQHFWHMSNKTARHYVVTFVQIAAITCASATAVHAQQAQVKAPLPANAPASARVQLPTQETMIILIRSSVLALGQANVTNNYTVLNALGSRAFSASNPPQKLATTFQSFRANRIDLAPVALINPQLAYQPSLANGRLRLVGNFPSKPMQVNFDLTYEAEDGVWKLSGLSVNLVAAAQTSASVMK